MQLFNTGNYTGVIALVSGTSDPALLLLAARSYAETGQYDTAGYLLRDLIQIMPGSSYLHSYLADVMKKPATNTQSPNTQLPSSSIPKTDPPSETTPVS